MIQKALTFARLARLAIAVLMAPGRPETCPLLVGERTTLTETFHLRGPVTGPGTRIRVGADSMIACDIATLREGATVEIGDRTSIGAGTFLFCGGGISIGSDVLISWACTIMDTDGHPLDWRRRGGEFAGYHRDPSLWDWDGVPLAPVVIQDKSWIGCNVVILKGVTIGEGSIIGAGSVVTKDIPPWTVAAGNPAQVIREAAR